MKETVAVILQDGLFTRRPDYVEVSDIISYMMTRESYAKAEDADGDPVKRFAITVTIEVQEIEI